MLNQGVPTIIFLSAVLQHPIGSNGEKNTVCYMRKSDERTILCVAPSTVMCCNQRLSVGLINVYGRNTCNSVSLCGSAERCCASRDILNVSREYVASIEQLFRSTHCFNDLDSATIHLLPHTNGLVSVIVSYSCIATTTTSAAIATSFSSTASAISTLSAPSTALVSSATSATRTLSATSTASTQPQPKTIQDGTSNVVIALAVSLSIVSVAFVVVVTVMCVERNRATPHISMSKDNGIDTVTHDQVEASTSGTQYVNVVPQTYEQLSRQHTDGEYSELSKDGRDCNHGDLLQEGQRWGSRAYYNGNEQAGHDGTYVNSA